MTKKILLGYAGSWAFGMKTFYEMEKLKERLRRNPKDKKVRKELERIKRARANHGTPIYVSKKKYKELQKFQELEYLSGFT